MSATAEAAAARSEGAAGLLSRMLEADLARPLPLAILSAVYLASRVPLLNLGYGADPDTYRVALSARYLRDHASYLPSRLPGYPVHELVTALLFPLGPVATNAATMVVSLLAVWWFALLVRDLRLPMRALLVVAFAFAPLTWINSTVTHDFLWAISFMLAGYLAATRGRWRLAGLLLGLAAGCRLTSAALVIALLPLAWRSGRRAAVTLAVTAAITALVVYSPVWVRYGIHTFAYSAYRPPIREVMRAVTSQFLGLPAFVVLVAALLWGWRRLGALPGRLRDDPHLLAWTIEIGVVVLMYSRLPVKEDYLLPVIPFGLMWLARVMPRGWTGAIAGLMLLANGVTVYTASPQGWLAPTSLLDLRPRQGLLLQDRQLRVDRMQTVERVGTFCVPDHSVVTIGFYFPYFAEIQRDRLQWHVPPLDRGVVGPLTDKATLTPAGHDIKYVWLLDKKQALAYLARGYTIYSTNFLLEDRAVEVFDAFPRGVQDVLAKYGKGADHPGPRMLCHPDGTLTPAPPSADG